MNLNFDGVNIALQVDFSANASLNHHNEIQLIHWWQEQSTTYARIGNGKAIEDGLLSKMSESLSQIKIDDQTSGFCIPRAMKMVFTDQKAKYIVQENIEFSVGANLQFKQR